MAQFDPELELLGDDVLWMTFYFRRRITHSRLRPCLLRRRIISLNDVLPQRALYGRILSQQHVHGCLERVQSQKLYINTNAHSAPSYVAYR